MNPHQRRTRRNLRVPSSVKGFPRSGFGSVASIRDEEVYPTRELSQYEIGPLRVRVLHGTTIKHPKHTEGVPSSAAPKPSSDPNSSSTSGSGSHITIMLTSVVGCLILLFYCICMAQFFRMGMNWGRRREGDEAAEEEETAGEELKFNLTPRQRRAVLESIFSENSKAFKKVVMVAKGKPSSSLTPKEEDCNNGSKEGKASGALVPVSTVPSDDATSTSSLNCTREEGGVQPPRSSLSPTPANGDDSETANIASPLTEATTPMSSTCFDDDEDEGGRCNGEGLSLPASLSTHAIDDRYSRVDADPVVALPLRSPRHRLPLLPDLHSIDDGDHEDLNNDDEDKGGKRMILSCLSEPPPLPTVETDEGGEAGRLKDEWNRDEDEENDVDGAGNHMEQFSPKLSLSLDQSLTVAETEDIFPGDAEGEADMEEEEGVPDCAICLCAYEEGDIIITGKHCSHRFHKDCIFDWLAKHDVCPCCRTDMVSNNEINNAANKLVAKINAAISVEMEGTPQTPPPSPTWRIMRNATSRNVRHHRSPRYGRRASSGTSSQWRQMQGSSDRGTPGTPTSPVRLGTASHVGLGTTSPIVWRMGSSDS